MNNPSTPSATPNRAEPQPGQTLPNGTVTFLLTDMEGSTKLAQQYPEAMSALLARHNEILNQVQFDILIPFHFRRNR